MQNVYLWIGLGIVCLILVQARLSILRITQNIISDLTSGFNSYVNQATYAQQTRRYLESALSDKLEIFNTHNDNTKHALDKYKSLLIYNKPQHLERNITNILTMQLIAHIQSDLDSVKLEPKPSDIESLISLL